MGAYIARRLLASLPVLFLVSIVAFTLVTMMPGDAAVGMFGAEARSSDVEQARRALGLDDPLPVRYWNWLVDVLHGDFGESIRLRQSVLDAVVQRLPVTFQLALAGMVVMVLVGVPVGVLSALRPESRLDLTFSTIAMLGIAVPNFWLAILLILLFALKLGWLPPSGYASLLDDPIRSVQLLILPAIALGASHAAELIRIVRSSMLEVLGHEYIVTARAKGLEDRQVLVRHALRNALLPAVTITGLQMGRLFGGAVITETVFAIPGIGRLAVDSINSRDFPVVQCVVLLMAVGVLLSNLLVDLIYAYLDPRIRY